ncbi:hypothetical protein SAMN05216215_1010147 [Saccharopolyspora shandongensis]|uniref:Sporulation and spore germination n=1 Tax=Saccharopolyspora shandongensis TaxID=418495 RepID=A0A1H3BE67_9PSEU|nr:hypothetical protein [Saccharopolyspora shandongensis]SDX39694.1 hypothetical protein SAMN05216215_1010147 [Saccharopolyspora shandongensis]
MLAGISLVAGCGGAATNEVSDAGDPPTGIAVGPTMYYLKGNTLRPVIVPTGGTVRDVPFGKLGDVRGAVQYLMLGAGLSGSEENKALRTEVPKLGAALVNVNVVVTDRVITVVLPSYDLSPLAVDQVVCTALAVDSARGGTTRGKTVDILLHKGITGDRIAGRTCPAIS